MFSAVYETKFSHKCYLSKCTFIVKLHFQEKDFLAQREMKWKVKRNVVPAVLVLTWHVLVHWASDVWKDARSVCVLQGGWLLPR